jgi:hypothetical protein
MVSKHVPGFKPGSNGFHFGNDFETAPVLTMPVPPFGKIPVGNSAGGLCGGMVFAVLDIFRHGRKPPPDTVAPRPGTPLFEYLTRRLLDSFNGVSGVFKYLAWMQFPDDTHWYNPSRSIGWHTVNGEWPAIKADLDDGQLCPLGVVEVKSLNPLELGNNHQVLAYGYDLDEGAGDLKVLVYDPNNPDDDGVTLAVNLADPDHPSRVTFSADPDGRGFFRTAYTPADPSAALAFA